MWVSGNPICCVFKPVNDLSPIRVSELGYGSKLAQTTSYGRVTSNRERISRSALSSSFSHTPASRSALSSTPSMKSTALRMEMERHCQYDRNRGIRHITYSFMQISPCYFFWKGKNKVLLALKGADEVDNKGKEMGRVMKVGLGSELWAASASNGQAQFHLPTIGSSTPKGSSIGYDIKNSLEASSWLKDDCSLLFSALRT